MQGESLGTEHAVQGVATAQRPQTVVISKECGRPARPEFSQTGPKSALCEVNQLLTAASTSNYQSGHKPPLSRSGSSAPQEALRGNTGAHRSCHRNCTRARPNPPPALPTARNQSLYSASGETARSVGASSGNTDTEMGGSVSWKSRACPLCKAVSHKVAFQMENL